MPAAAENHAVAGLFQNSASTAASKATQP